MLSSVPMQCLPRRRSKKSGGPSYTAMTRSPLRCWNPTERALGSDEPGTTVERHREGEPQDGLPQPLGGAAGNRSVACRCRNQHDGSCASSSSETFPQLGHAKPHESRPLPESEEGGGRSRACAPGPELRKGSQSQKDTGSFREAKRAKTTASASLEAVVVHKDFAEGRSRIPNLARARQESIP